MSIPRQVIAGSGRLTAGMVGNNALNAICPYFTMFPLSFPVKVLRRSRTANGVLDPFCGRGTTNMAARLRGMPTIGIDSNPLAAAVTSAKLVATTPEAVVRELSAIMTDADKQHDVPSGEFWSFMYDARTLKSLVHVRDALLQDCQSPERVALRAVILGALHGPLAKHAHSYLSNQAPRTYAPKPDYAVRYWKRRNLRPPRIDLAEVIMTRAHRYYQTPLPTPAYEVRCADSRDPSTFAGLDQYPVSWIVTSPPYLGLNTYQPDQWLRLWFLGGPPTVDYTPLNQLQHSSPDSYAEQLAKVWTNCRLVTQPRARMVIRFGGIPSRPSDPLEILKASLHDTGWRIQTRCDAGTAPRGKRQGDQFGVLSTAQSEFDLWTIRDS